MLLLSKTPTMTPVAMKRKIFLVLALVAAIACHDTYFHFYPLEDEHLQQVLSFIKDNQNEFTKMSSQLKLDVNQPESNIFPFDPSQVVNYIAGEEFSAQFPNASRAGFKSVAFYNSCLYLSDRKRGLSTELLYCKNNISNTKVSDGLYRSLGDGWYLMRYNGYFGANEGFHYP